MRKLGLSCDNVRAFEIVTADGKLRTASAEENSDLYWGLRGGGGNFGVVTRFDYELHPLDHPVLAGSVLYPFSQARSALAAMIELAATAPDELYLTGGLTNISPPPPGSPPGKLAPGHYVAIEAVYSGAPADGEKAVAPLAKLGKPAAGQFSAKPYVQAQNGFTGAAPPALPAGLGVYVKSGFVNTISDKLLDDMLRGFQSGPEWLDGIGFGLCGGAVARVKPMRRPTGIARLNGNCSFPGHGSITARTSTMWRCCAIFGKPLNPTRKATTSIPSPRPTSSGCARPMGTITRGSCS
jgi:hypothetical protein